MALLYLIENYLKGLPIGSYTTTSTDPLYIVTNLANGRPSLPYRTLTKLDPESVCIDLDTPKTVTFVGLFNHNLTTTPTILRLWGCTDCDTCVCQTDLRIAPTDPCGEGCGTQPIAKFSNSWSNRVSCPAYQYWKLEVTDTPEEDYIEIGELVLGQWQQFPRGVLDTPTSPAWVRLSPGRADGPEFFMGKQRTHYGQDWSTYYSDCERFDLTLTTQNDPCIVDAIHTFLRSVQRLGGSFVLIPDDTKPFCYYVTIDNLRDFADRLIYGRDRELREWRLKLKTLTEGVRLL